jgi:hypothetical protein
MNKSKKIPLVLLKIAIGLRKILCYFKQQKENKDANNKVEPSKDKKQPDNSSSGLIVIENFVYQLDSQKSNLEEAKNDPEKSDPKTSIAPDESVQVKKEGIKHEEDETKKKEFEENMSATNYLAFFCLFLIELVCNTAIYCSLTS